MRNLLPTKKEFTQYVIFWDIPANASLVIFGSFSEHFAHSMRAYGNNTITDIASKSFASPEINDPPRW